MVATMNVATFMGKNFSTIQNFIKTFEDPTLKQMFDVTVELVNDPEEIHGFDKIHWEKNFWKSLSLIGDELTSISNAQKSMFYRILCCTSRIQRSLEEQSCGSTSREKLQRF